MSHDIDELSKALAEERIPRRESLRRLGAVLAGAILSPFALGTARAGPQDPCKAFCHCHNRQQQNACLAACHTCYGDTSRLCGACGSIVCCDEPDPYEEGACVNGQCTYWCVDGAAACGGGPCTLLWLDPDNCGACGNVCPDSAPFCDSGTCVCPGTVCGGQCVDVLYDPYNCGACGNVCPDTAPICASGTCRRCPATTIACNGKCVDPQSDNSNCGGCGLNCGGGYVCAAGACCDPTTEFCNQ